jgi:hypothetical protein
MPDFKNYFPQTWGNKIQFSSDMIPRDGFQLLFYNLHLAHAADQEQIKKERQIKPAIEKNLVKVHPSLLARYHCNC